MKTTTFLKCIIALLCCTMLFSCVKKSLNDSNPTIANLPAITGAFPGAPYSDFADTTWKGVIWVPWGGSWGNSTGVTKDASDITAAGITWDRFWLSANMTTTHVDSIVKAHTDHSIKMVAMYYKEYPVKDLGTPAQQITEVAALKAWVLRYKDRIHYWEVQSEENTSLYWNINYTGQGSTDPNTPYNLSVHNYIVWLKKADSVIHVADPAATVILGGVTGSTTDVGTFMDRITAESAYNYFDEVALHPYALNNDPTPEHSIDGLIAFKAKMSAWPSPLNNMPIWITEVGFHVGSISSPGTVPDDSTKAAYLKETLSKLIQTLPWKRPIFWYNFQEAVPANDYYNLIQRTTAGGTTTYLPAYTTYQIMHNSWDFWKTGVPGTVDMYEAENLTILATSGKAVSTFTDALCSAGKGLKYASTVVGDSIVIKVPAVTPGSYKVWVHVKQTNTRGQCVLKIRPLGSSSVIFTSSMVDMYDSGTLYTSFNFGTLTVTAANDQQLSFKVSGKNSSSTGYDMAFDYIKLIRN